jgi:hypothetical protein
MRRLSIRTLRNTHIGRTPMLSMRILLMLMLRLCIFFYAMRKHKSSQSLKLFCQNMLTNEPGVLRQNVASLNVYVT